MAVVRHFIKRAICIDDTPWSPAAPASIELPLFFLQRAAVKLPSKRLIKKSTEKLPAVGFLAFTPSLASKNSIPLPST